MGRGVVPQEEGDRRDGCGYDDGQAKAGAEDRHRKERKRKPCRDAGSEAQKARNESCSLKVKRECNRYPSGVTIPNERTVIGT
jgi:hypothetical protein